MTPGRASRAALLFAMLLFVPLAWLASDRMMATSEELIALPEQAWKVALPLPTAPAPEGRVAFEPSCADTSSAGSTAHLLLSKSRPTLSWCVDGRTNPILAAPQYAALFTLPLGLFDPITHGDIFLLRKLALIPLGLLALWLANRVIARAAGDALAAWAAIGMAVSPCFVLLYAFLQPYETLPWLFTLAALDVLLGCAELAPRAESSAEITTIDSADGSAPSTRRLALAALFVGLGALAAIKEIFFVVPLVVVAVRLRVRFDRVHPKQWALVAALVLLPMLPMAIPIAMDPSMSFATGRGGNWISVLADTIRRPGKIVDAARELVLFGSNVGRLLANARPNLVSAAVASVVVLVVVGDTACTLVRRRGCSVTAASGAILVTYLFVLTFLYRDFPPNYMPLHAVYGVALGAFAFRLVTLLRSRAHLPRGAASALAGALFVPFAWSTRETIDDVADVAIVTNAHAERALARYLMEHVDPPARTVTTSLLMGGVVDALTGNRVRTVQAHPLIDGCRHANGGGGGDHGTADGNAGTNADTNERCLYDAFRALFAGEAREQNDEMRVVFSASYAALRRPESLRLTQRDQMARAAQDLGLDLRLEETFRTPSGAPAIELYRVRRADK